MSEIYFYPNDIFFFTNENRRERVVWQDFAREHIATIELDVDLLNIKIYGTEEIKEKIVDGEVTVTKEDVVERFIDSDIFTELEKEKMNKAYEIVEFIEKEGGEACLVNSKDRGKWIKEATKKFTISKKQIYVYLRRYWQSGRRKTSLLPHYHQCGSKGKDICFKKKTGRPSNKTYLDGQVTGIILDDETKKIFESSINKYFLKNGRISFAKSYAYMLKDWCSAKGITLDDPEDVYEQRCPTLRQYQYWYDTNKNLEKQIRGRLGDKKYQKDYRNLAGDSISETRGPGYRYQVDATIADIYLVSRKDRSAVIGRPVIYIAVDVFSRLITAVHVGIEGGGWNGAATLIYNMATDKVAYCKQYGIEISQEEWPSTGLPNIILGDRGEMVGPIAQETCAELGVTLENTPSYRGDAKGIVEQKFRTVQSEFKKCSPGVINKAYRERGEKDYREEAKLDIDQFTKMILEIVLYENKKYLKDFTQIEDMRAEHIPAIPIDMWQWGIANVSGALRSISEDRLKKSLLRKGKASITESGILFKRIKYELNFKDSKEMEIYARYNGRTSIDIRYDNRNISKIYLVIEKQFIEAKLNYNFSDASTYECMSIEELDLLRWKEKIEKEKQGSKQVIREIQLNDKLKEIVDDSKKQSGKGKIEVKNIRENRVQEAVVHKMKQSLVTTAEEVETIELVAATIEQDVNPKHNDEKYNKGIMKDLMDLEDEFF